MTEGVKGPVKQTVEAAAKPVNDWRYKILEAGAIVSKSWRRYRAWLFQIYIVIAEIIFLVLAVLAKTVAYFTFDVTITHQLQMYHGPWFSQLMRFLTWMGFAPQGLIITVGIIGFLLLSGLKWESVVAAGSAIGSTLLGTGIKLVIHRPRPTADLVNVIKQLNDTSFPSGHVLFFMTFFGFVLFLVYTLAKPSWWRTLLMLSLTLLIVLIGPSRIYEGQHWASDVIAAYLLGSMWLGASIVVYRWGKPRFFVDQPVAKETPAAKDTALQKPPAPTGSPT
jgi:undecaprenyl-diphosphatase